MSLELLFKSEILDVFRIGYPSAENYPRFSSITEGKDLKDPPFTNCTFCWPSLFKNHSNPLFAKQKVTNIKFEG